MSLKLKNDLLATFLRQIARFLFSDHDLSIPESLSLKRSNLKYITHCDVLKYTSHVFIEEIRQAYNPTQL